MNCIECLFRVKGIFIFSAELSNAKQASEESKVAAAFLTWGRTLAPS